MTIDKAVVGALLGDELVVLANFNNATAVNNGNLVGVDDRGQPMCDQDYCTSIARPKIHALVEIADFEHFVLQLVLQTRDSCF